MSGTSEDRPTANSPGEAEEGAINAADTKSATENGDGDGEKHLTRKDVDTANSRPTAVATSGASIQPSSMTDRGGALYKPARQRLRHVLLSTTTLAVASVVLALAGVVIAFLAFVNDLGFFPHYEREADPRPGVAGSQPSNSGAATTSGGPVATQSSQRTLIGEITDPSNNEQVPMIITASGRTMGAVPPSHQLWLFVEFLPNGFFSPGAITQRGNQWVASDLYAGGPGQAGQSFNLHLTDLGPAARERLDVYFEDERRELERGGNPRGFGRAELEELDVEFLDEVAVHRRP